MLHLSVTPVSSLKEKVIKTRPDQDQTPCHTVSTQTHLTHTCGNVTLYLVIWLKYPPSVEDMGQNQKEAPMPTGTALGNA